MWNLTHSPVAESVGTRWQLVGSVQLVRRLHPSWYAAAHTPYCLKLRRQPDALSPFIRTGLSGKRILPGVTITTPDGTVTLRNARVMGIASQGHTSNDHTHEVEEFSFSFQKIEVDWQTGSIPAEDDWSAYPL
jgi:hypothetical protein